MHGPLKMTMTSELRPRIVAKRLVLKAESCSSVHDHSSDIDTHTKINLYTVNESRQRSDMSLILRLRQSSDACSAISSTARLFAGLQRRSISKVSGLRKAVNIGNRQ